MKHVEVRGKEILIANIDGKFYALNDRCGHMNALLSMGNLANDNIVTCPFHGARFDIISGYQMSHGLNLEVRSQLDYLFVGGHNPTNLLDME